MSSGTTASTPSSILMFVDAVFPAASRLVMVYAGAVAAGAFPGSSVTLFGTEIESTGWAYVAMAMAGTIGHARLGRGVGDRPVRRPAVPRTTRALAPHHARQARQGGRVVRALRRRRRLRLAHAPRGAVVHLHPRRHRRDAARPVHRAHLRRDDPWCFGLAAVGVALGSKWEEFHESFRYADYAIIALVVAGAPRSSTAAAAGGPGGVQ